MSIVKLLDAGSVGIVKDVPAWEIDDHAWSGGNNVRFKDGCVERVPGYTSSFGTVGHAVYGVFPCVDGSGNRYIVYPSLTAIKAVTGTTHYTITRAAGGAYGATADTKWCGGVLGGILVLQDGSGVDDPQYWVPQAGGNMAALTNWPASTKCRVITPYLSYLVAFDITESSTRYPQRVKWSAHAATGSLPSSWDETDTTKDSGEYDLGEGQDFIVGALQIGSQLAIYREQSVYLMRWVGGTSIFAFNKARSASGMLASNCVTDIPLGHVVLTNGDVVLFNSSEEKSILDGRMKKYLFSTIDSTNYKRSFVVSNIIDSEVLICYPTSGNTDCDRAIVWNWKTGALSIRDIPNLTSGATTSVTTGTPSLWSDATTSWTGDTGTWNGDVYSLATQKLVLGSTASKLYILNLGNTNDGTAFTSTIERTGITLGDAQAVKRVLSVYPRVDGTTGDTLGISVGVAMNADEPYTWSAEQIYSIGSSRKVDFRTSGRFLGLRLRSATSATLRFKSADIDVEMAGKR